MLMEKHRQGDINEAERETMIISMAKTMKGKVFSPSAIENLGNSEKSKTLLDTDRSLKSNNMSASMADK